MARPWEGIEEFVHVARAGSFTGGANSLGASVTHMSRAIAKLEEKLQRQLFVRSTRSLRLTDTGRSFFEKCSHIVEQREEAIAAVSSLHAAHGELRINCSHTLGERLVAPLACEFAREHPTLKVTLNLDKPTNDLIVDGFDLAIRPSPLRESGLIATRVATRNLVTVASPAYIANCGAPRNVAELGEHECVLGSSSVWYFKNELEFRPKGRWRCNNGVVMAMATLAGLGICQLPASYVQPYLANGKLTLVLEDWEPPEQQIWAIYAPRRHTPPKVRLFVELLRAKLQGILNSDRVWDPAELVC